MYLGTRNLSLTYKTVLEKSLLQAAAAQEHPQTIPREKRDTAAPRDLATVTGFTNKRQTYVTQMQRGNSRSGKGSSISVQDNNKSQKLTLRSDKFI